MEKNKESEVAVMTQKELVEAVKNMVKKNVQ